VVIVGAHVTLSMTAANGGPWFADMTCTARTKGDMIAIFAVNGPVPNSFREQTPFHGPSVNALLESYNGASDNQKCRYRDLTSNEANPATESLVKPTPAARHPTVDTLIVVSARNPVPAPLPPRTAPSPNFNSSNGWPIRASLFVSLTTQSSLTLLSSRQLHFCDSPPPDQ
jgi:hypothetical protein